MTVTKEVFCVVCKASGFPDDWREDEKENVTKLTVESNEIAINRLCDC